MKTFRADSFGDGSSACAVGAALCLFGVTLFGGAQTISSPSPIEAPQRPVPVYSNPGMATGGNLPNTGNLPQGNLPPGGLPQTAFPRAGQPQGGLPTTAFSSELSRRLPAASTKLPGTFGQSRAYFYLTHPDAVPTTNSPALTEPQYQGTSGGMLGGRVLANGQDDVIVTIVKVPRYFDAELEMLSPSRQLLGTNFNAGKVINLGKLPAGEIIFSLKVTSTQLVYPTGPGIRNPDGLPHAVVQPGGPKDKPAVFVGFEDVMTMKTTARTFDDAVLQISGGVMTAINAPPTPPSAPTAAAVKKKKK